MQLMLLILTYSYSTTFILYESTLYLSLYMKGELRYMIVIFGGHLGRHLGKYATDLNDFYIFILYDLHFIWINTLFVSVFKRRAEIHLIVIFGGHLGRHLGKYATDVIDFYILILYKLHFIWIDTLFVSVFERRAEIHLIQNFGGHVGRHLGKFIFHIFPNSWPYMWYTCKIWLKYSQ